VLAVGWMPVRPQKLERIASYARECLMDPGAYAEFKIRLSRIDAPRTLERYDARSPEVSLSGYCPKMQSISALDARMVPDPALKLSN
jgi:hypothetical protein